MLKFNKNLKTFITNFHNVFLKDRDDIFSYVKERGITEGIARAEHLLYVPYAAERDEGGKYTIADGFYAPKYWNGYLILPIRDPHNYNEIASFTSRNYSNIELGVPAHKHCPCSQEFMLGQDSVSKNAEEVFLVEGMFDYLSARTLKLNALGLLGVNNFKSSHADFIVENYKTIYILFDNDRAGNEASKTVTKKIHETNLEKLNQINVFRVKPKEHDLNDWLVAGATIEDIETACARSVEIQVKKSPPKKKVEEKIESSYNKYSTEYLLELARSAGEVERVGNKWRMKCISGEHEDKEASLYFYNNDKGLYCFSCGLRNSKLFERYVKEITND